MSEIWDPDVPWLGQFNFEYLTMTILHIYFESPNQWETVRNFVDGKAWLVNKVSEGSGQLNINHVGLRKYWLVKK